MLITRKVICDENGNALEAVEYSSKSGDNFNHKAEWARFPRSITNKHPYNYYPRGRVEIKKNKATVYVNPVLNTPSVMELVDMEFGLCNGTIPTRTVADGSSHYDYLMDYPIKCCNVCGKIFDFWDNQEDFCFERYIGYGSEYGMERIRLNLCCECFDKTLDWLLPQCVNNPMMEYN